VFCVSLIYGSHHAADFYCVEHSQPSINLGNQVSNINVGLVNFRVGRGLLRISAVALSARHYSGAGKFFRKSLVSQREKRPIPVRVC
jgi:hypothetical protein